MEGCVGGGEGKGRSRGTACWFSTAVSVIPTLLSSYNFSAVAVQSPLYNPARSDPGRVGLQPRLLSAASAAAPSLAVLGGTPGLDIKNAPYVHIPSFNRGGLAHSHGNLLTHHGLSTPTQATA